MANNPTRKNTKHEEASPDTTLTFGKVLLFCLFIFMAIYVNFFHFRPLEIKYRKPYVFTSSEHGYIGLGGQHYSIHSGVEGLWKLEAGGENLEMYVPSFLYYKRWGA